MSEFTQYLQEAFEKLGSLSMRRMFKGYTLYHQAYPIGIVFDDALFLKADEQNAHYFQAIGLEQFAYEKQGKWIKLPYYRAPDFLLEDREEAAIWGRRSFEAALRMGNTKRRKSRPDN